MSTITVLGAGAMGSAICTPLADAGWDVRLTNRSLISGFTTITRMGANGVL